MKNSSTNFDEKHIFGISTTSLIERHMSYLLSMKRPSDVQCSLPTPAVSPALPFLVVLLFFSIVVPSKYLMPTFRPVYSKGTLAYELVYLPILIMVVENNYCTNNPNHNICTKLHHLSSIISKDKKVISSVATI